MCSGCFTVFCEEGALSFPRMIHQYCISEWHIYTNIHFLIKETTTNQVLVIHTYTACLKCLCHCETYFFHTHVLYQMGVNIIFILSCHLTGAIFESPPNLTNSPLHHSRLGVGETLVVTIHTSTRQSISHAITRF